MSSVDIPARAIARKAIEAGSVLGSETGASQVGVIQGGTVQSFVDIADNGVANMRACSAPTAKALETLAHNHAALSGYAGATHVVETSPYLAKDYLTIRGNGSRLVNVNPTEVGVNDVVNVALPLGTSNFKGSGLLDYHAIISATGTTLTLEEGAGADFKAGDNVYLHGELKYAVTTENKYRNNLRSRVLKVQGDQVTIEDALPAPLMDDRPVIANASKGTPAGYAGPESYYLLYRPYVCDLTLRSEKGEAWKWGGIIKGEFRNITIEGRNGFAFNALQDCLFDGIRFRSWRKMVELGEGSYSSTIRNISGSLYSIGKDEAPFLAAIHENSHFCTVEKFDLDSGYSTASGNAVQLATGSYNVFRDGIFRLPKITGNCLSIYSRPEPGLTSADCGFENVSVFAGAPVTFFSITNGGAGTIRPFLKNVKFHGKPTGRAGNIDGTDGVLDRVWCEEGALMFTGPCTGWNIENCYFPGGIVGLTGERLKTNRIRNNESNASRRIAAAAVVSAQQVTHNALQENSLAYEMKLAAGDLAQFDEVHYRIEGIAQGGGANVRHIRVTCSIDGVTDVEVAHMKETVNNSGMIVEGRLSVRSDIAVYSRSTVHGSGAPAQLQRSLAGDLATKGLTLKVEIWTETSGNVVLGSIALAGQKAGMRNVPVFSS